MAPSLPPETTVAHWLRELGVTSLCQWDALRFLCRHQTTLLGVADLARLLGYPSTTLVVALDSLVARRLIERSRVSQGVRLYRCGTPPDAPRREALAQLLALAAHRPGRLLLAGQLRRDLTPVEQLEAAPHCLADAKQRLRVLRRQTDEITERRTLWRKAT